MTEPVQGVIKTGVVERRTTAQERLRRLYLSSHHHDEEVETDDTVEISQEARQRADGTYRKNILEHIEEEEEDTSK